MAEEKTYVEELEEELKEAQKRLAKARNASNFLDNAKAAFEVLDARVSIEVGKMNAKEPLDREDYLVSYAKVRAWREFRIELMGDASRLESLNAEVTSKNEQLEAAKQAPVQ